MASLARDLRAFVIRPTLQHIGLWSPVAEDLVLGTAAVESGFQALDQIGRGGETGFGPAVGLWQMEKATHDDLFFRVLALSGNTILSVKVKQLLGGWPDAWTQLATNLAYGAAMCRLRYWIDREPLPAQGDLDAYAACWKRVYNGPGAGTPAAFVAAWKRLCG